MAVDAWVGLWPMKRSGRAELDHTWRGIPSGHQSCLQGEEKREEIQLKSFQMPQGKSQNCQELQDYISFLSVTIKSKDSKEDI